MLALLVGGCGSWAVSRKTPIYFILYSNKFHQNFLFVIKKTWLTYKKTWNAYKKREMHTKQYHTYIYIYVCMYVCMYVYMYVCLYSCRYVSIFVGLYIHMNLLKCV